MKILVLCQDDINKTPPLIRISNMFEVRGYSLTIVCFGEGSRVLKKLYDYKEPCKASIFFLEPTSIRIFRPIIDLIRLSVWIMKQRYEQYDVIIAYNPIPLLSLAFTRSILNGLRVYYAAELWDSSRFLFQRLCEYLSKSTPDCIINCQEDRQRILEERLGIQKAFHILPNSCFDNYFRDTRQVKERTHSINTLFVYHGGLQPKERALNELVDIFGSGTIDSVALVLIMRSQEKILNKFTERVMSQKYKQKISFKKYLPYPDVFRELVQCHVGIVLYKNISLNYRYCAPNRLYEYAMLGMPVLASNQSHIANIVEKERIGVCVDPENVDDIIAGIRYLCNEADLDKMGENARSWFLKKGNYVNHYREFEIFFLREFNALLRKQLL